MPRFELGDHVKVTNPVPPTGHQGGETGTVVDRCGHIVRIQHDHDGKFANCFQEELSAD